MILPCTNKPTELLHFVINSNVCALKHIEAMKSTAFYSAEERISGFVKLPPPSIFLVLNFCSLTDCQKVWHNCSLFVNTSFDTN